MEIIANMPAALPLVALAALASALTMKLYQWTSRQERISALKLEAKESQRELASFDGEFDEMMPLIKRSLGASLKMLGLATGPALLASIPVVFILAWASTRFAYVPPETGSALEVRVEAAADVQLDWQPESATTETAPGIYQVTWPVPGSELALSADGQQQLALPVPTSPIVHVRQWWNALFPNPAGYLPDDSPLVAVHLDLAQQEFLPFGPPWMRSWLTLMLLGILGFSLLFKFWWKIH